MKTAELMEKQEVATKYWRSIYHNEVAELYNKPKYEEWLELKALKLEDIRDIITSENSGLSAEQRLSEIEQITK